MMVRTTKPLIFLSILFACFVGVFAKQNPTTSPQAQGPEITSYTPQLVSVNSVVELEGVRLSATDESKVKAYFIQNGNRFPAKTIEGWSTTNNQANGPQSRDVIVPGGLGNGPTQFVLEVNGLRTAPLALSVVEYKLPELKALSPKSGSAGTVVWIECSGFHANDEIVLTDSQGKVTHVENTDSRSALFKVPQDAFAGVMKVQIGNPHYVNNQLSEPLSFVVSSDPPLELRAEATTAVAPGQWIDLQAENYESLKRSQLTEVSYKQSGRSIVVTAPNSHRPHVVVPAALLPGAVEVQVRTWVDGQPSTWSESVELRLLESPVPPRVDALRLLQAGEWVQLWPGPERAKSFSAKPGDVVVLHGSFPVADASNLKVSLIGSTGAIELSVSELEQKTNWFGDVCVKLPDALTQGNWRMIVNGDDGTSAELPIAIHIK